MLHSLLIILHYFKMKGPPTIAPIKNSAKMPIKKPVKKPAKKPTPDDIKPVNLSPTKKPLYGRSSS